MSKSKKRSAIWLSIILALILICSAVQYAVMTDFGNVRVEDISWVTDDGAYMSARIYIPVGVDAANPAPAVICAHGYNNTLEVQEVNCIELSRRGYVVISADAYGHGNSTQAIDFMTDDDMADGSENATVNSDAEGDAAVQDGGVYSALQYLGTLPFVDESSIGLIGHSMGGYTIQMAALRALINKQNGKDVIVPKAIMVTCEGADADYGELGLNVATVTPEFDEWGSGHWNVTKSALANTSAKLKAYFGFTEDAPDVEYGSFYRYGEQATISRSGAISAAKEDCLRVAYLVHGRVHPGVHNSSEAVEYMVDYFGITLKGGASDSISAGNQTWLIKNIAGLASLILFFVMMIPVTGLFIETKFFAGLVRTPYEGVTLADKKSKIGYVLLFILGLVPGALLLYPLFGNPISVKFMGFACPIPWQESVAFPMPVVNGLALFNLGCGLCALILFVIAYFFIAKKNSASFGDYGFKISFKDTLKSLLLAIIVFLSSYMALALAYYFFKVDFRFFTLSIKTINAIDWSLFLRYVIFFAAFYVVNSLTLNASVSFKNNKEWVNYLLCIIMNVGGVLAVHIIDYVSFYTTGYKLLGNYSSLGGNSSLAGIVAWGLLLVLPLAAIIARALYKKTGNIWIGGLINTLAVTLFAISNTVVSTAIYN